MTNIRDEVCVKWQQDDLGILVVKSGNDFLDDRHWLQRRTEESEERKCRQNDRSEHRSVNMARTDQGCTNTRTSVPENNRGK